MELCQLIGRAATQDIYDQILAPHRLNALLMSYWGSLHAPWAPRPIDPNTVQAFAEIINESNTGLLARAVKGAA